MELAIADCEEPIIRDLADRGLVVPDDEKWRRFAWRPNVRLCEGLAFPERPQWAQNDPKG